MDTYKNRTFSKEHDAIFQKFAPAWQAYTKNLDQALQLSNGGKDAEFKALLQGDMKKSGDELNAVLDELINFNVKNAEIANMEGKSLYSAARSITITIIIMSLIISLGAGYLIAQVISRPLKRILELVDKVAGGI
jgi:methyl-accepting chemotaxis protein